jgi:EAL domain-containing protein (putative c-di-GMP-specific phosphodiesterase class I)
VGPDGQVMVPEDFLPQARRFGTMAIIDRFMVARGIGLARAGRRVAMNLSADSINNATTIGAIIEDLRQAGDAATRVSFEITEHAVLASTELSEHFSNEMRALGCRLALDDFGTGFGSFTELRGMTLHSLKIDQRFVRDLLGNNQDESVVRAIIATAREFGLLTTAEGVEDLETKNRLIELGVDQLQGYLIGVPVPATVNGVAPNN